MIPAEKIIVALDYSDKNEALKTMKTLQGRKVWVKIGMELFYAEGPRVIHEAKDLGFKVFLDLKLHDIPNTVGQGIKSLARLPIDMINVHAAGGKAMMEKAREAVEASQTRPLVIAVTQLTSTTTQQMNTEQGISGDILESVIRLSKLTKESGLDGVVSSPHEVRAIKEHCGTNFLTITPGIRPKESQAQDQKRITTPDEALKLGTDFMVIGRPITQAPDPKLALEKILQGT